MGQAQSTNLLPDLPDVSWAKVFEYQCYDEVVRASRVSKFFLDDAIPQALTFMSCLYICDSRALTVEQADRFGGEDGNMKEIVIDSIYFKIDHIENDRTARCWRLRDATTDIVPFLTRFAKLRNAFLGRGIRESKREILGRLHLEPCADGLGRFCLKQPLAELETNNLLLQLFFSQHTTEFPFRRIRAAYEEGRLSRMARWSVAL